MRYSTLGMASCLLVSSVATAQSVVIAPRAEVGFTSYSLEFNGTFAIPALGGLEAPANAQLGGTLFTQRAGVTAIFGDFYIDGLISATSDLSDTQIVEGLGEPLVEDWTGSRDEYNITLGYALFDAGSVFIGYRDGEIEGDGQLNSVFSYETDGFYLGATYGFALTESGSLGLNIAFAQLDSTLKETLFGLPLPDAQGDGNGLKFGITWQDFLSDNVRYSVSFDQYRYQTNVELDDLVDVEMTEEEQSIRVGLTYFF